MTFAAAESHCHDFHNVVVVLNEVESCSPLGWVGLVSEIMDFG